MRILIHACTGEPEQRARFEDHGQLRYAAYADEKGGDPQYNTVKGWADLIGRPSASRSIDVWCNARRLLKNCTPVYSVMRPQRQAAAIPDL